MKTNCLFQITFQIKNLKTRFCCLKLMKTSHIICISKIKTDLCLTKQRIKTEKTFVRIACSVLVVKIS